MAYQIRKHEDAPEGDVRVGIANTDFKVSDDKPYETDDAQVIEAVQSHYSDLLVVEVGQQPSSDKTARQAAADDRKLQREQAKAEKKRAEKDPQDPAPEVPTTVDELAEGDK